MAHSARISGGAAVAKEFGRTLSARGAVFARIRIATIDRQTRIENDLVFAAVFFLLPVGRQPVIAVDRYHAHTTDESVFCLAAAD